jgi:hypothetical protein
LAPIGTSFCLPITHHSSLRQQSLLAPCFRIRINTALTQHTAFTMQSMSFAYCGVDEGGGVSLKACKSCMLVKYCNRKCQQNHWPKHKKPCKQRAAELHDEALFKDYPICFLPMPEKLINCVSLPLQQGVNAKISLCCFSTANPLSAPDRSLQKEAAARRRGRLRG